MVKSALECKRAYAAKDSSAYVSTVIGLQVPAAYCQLAAEVSVRRLRRRTSAGGPRWAWPEPLEQLLLLCWVSWVLRFLVFGWARVRVLSNGRPTGSNAFPCGARHDW